jgi:hypothetical protein
MPVAAGYDQSFLSTQRAVASCSREFARLSESIADAVVASLGDTEHEKVVVRQSPERCIVQVGHAALTVAWLRNNRDSIAEGELLVIHWHGIVAPSVHFRPERLSDRAPLTARPLSETIFTPEATCETDWMWRSDAPPAQRYTSTLLAQTLADRLRQLYDELRDVPEGATA